MGGGPIERTRRALRGARETAGVVRGSGPMPREAEALLEDDAFARALQKAAVEHGTDEATARREATGYLKEMAADHREGLAARWKQFGDWFMRAYEVWVDEEEIDRLRRLDSRYALGLAFAHRSYLDGFVVPNTLGQRRFSPTYTFGGANLDLPVIGNLASRTGIIFIRRSTGDLPLYRLTLRHYITQLVRSRRNVTWSIEGGRTRTGKLRPPVHGILKYLTDAVEEGADDVMIVPVSVVYDQLHELQAMTAEARGAKKTPEDLRWMVRFARQQRDRLGRAYLSVGEPFSLRERYEGLLADGMDEKQAVERIALDVSHRLNRATPVTVTAIVSLAILGADRSLTLDEVLSTVRPLAGYIEARGWPVAGAANLLDRNTIRRTLQELVSSGVLTCFDEGTEPVWGIGPDQHLIAAFYRNTAIHMLVERAIGEVVLLAASEARLADDEDATGAAWVEAKRLRDLLKFEFFFSARDDFERELRAELGILDAEAAREDAVLTPETARRLLEGARPHLAHLVLRPFLDAYAVLADRLAAAGDEVVDEDALLADALRVGQQWVLQKRVANAESVTLELYRTALALARHRGLVPAHEEYGLEAKRQEFADEISEVVRRLQAIADLSASRGDAG